MIEKLWTINTSSLDPYHNIALEEYLMDTLPLHSALLYLWQNERTVVIGKNQCAANEVNIQALEKDGGHLARRLSGGGAVYHDLGNLNFTFLMKEEDFDVQKQTEVILKALKRLGIEAEVSGRNDLTIAGQKFSGHAYYHHGGNAYHHGTLMVDVDREKMTRYLNVSQKKLADKHVKSVKSRVINLIECHPGLKIEALKEALIYGFEEVYQLPSEEIYEEGFDLRSIKEREKRFASAEWKYDKEVSYDYALEKKFPWGLVNLRIKEDQGILKNVVIYTDAMDLEILDHLPGKLKDQKFDESLLRLAESEEEKEVIQYLLEGR